MRNAQTEWWNYHENIPVSQKGFHGTRITWKAKTPEVGSTPHSNTSCCVFFQIHLIRALCALHMTGWCGEIHYELCSLPKFIVTLAVYYELWIPFSWWRHQMETFFASLALCAGNSPDKGQWRGAVIFFFHLCLNKRLSKRLWGWWFETPSRSLWRHQNEWEVTHPHSWKGKDNDWFRCVCSCYELPEYAIFNLILMLW